MHAERITVFLPCHSLEDFPTWLEDAESEEILAAWTAAWDPRLLVAAGHLPCWASVDVAPVGVDPLLGIVPPHCEDRLMAMLDATCLVGTRWVRRVQGRGAIVATALKALALGEDTPGESPTAPGLPALSAAGNTTDTPLEMAVIRAARAAVAGDQAAAREALRESYGILEGARAHYYPVDVWLLDLVLIAEGMGVHIPKGYVYVAMGFSLSVELLNIRSREKKKKTRV